MIKSLLGGLNGKKVTPNQFAKQAVFDKGSEAFYFDSDDMTAREVEMINEAIQKQLDRVAKFLGGYDSLYDGDE